MTHEYDDPIDAEQLAQAVRYVVERFRAEDRDLNALVSEVVAERFCGCVASRQTSADASVREGLIAEIGRQARELVDGGWFDKIDEASIESFPASDPPAWINHAGRGDR